MTMDNAAVKRNTAITLIGRRTIGRTFFIALVITLAASLAYVNLRPASLPRLLLTLPHVSGDQRYARLDAIFSSAARNGNVLFRSGDASMETGSEFNIVAEIYCHENYTVYPHRIFIGDDTTAINQNQGFVPYFDPSAQWLLDHDIRSIVTMHRESNGSFSVDVKSI
jgi:hypothetical protein